MKHIVSCLVMLSVPISVCASGYTLDNLRTAYTNKASIDFLARMITDNPLPQPTPSGTTLLHALIDLNLPPADASTLVTAALKKGAQLDAPDKQGHTPLHRAVATSDNYMVHLLLQAGADYTKKDLQGCTPLHVAAQTDRDMAELFYKAASCKPIPDFVIDAQTPAGHTPLICAAYRLSFLALVGLLAYGADHTLINKEGRTALGYVLQRLCSGTILRNKNDREHVINMAQVLLEAGAQLSVADKIKFNALRCPDHRVAALLVLAGQTPADRRYLLPTDETWVKKANNYHGYIQQGLAGVGGYNDVFEEPAPDTIPVGIGADGKSTTDQIEACQIEACQIEAWRLLRESSLKRQGF